MGGIGSPNLPLPETRHLVLLGATDWGGAQKGLTKAKKTIGAAGTSTSHASSSSSSNATQPIHDDEKKSKRKIVLSNLPEVYSGEH